MIASASAYLAFFCLWKFGPIGLGNRACHKHNVEARGISGNLILFSGNGGGVFYAFAAGLSWLRFEPEGEALPVIRFMALHFFAPKGLAPASGEMA
ncbi:hypothetical protein J21TS3_20250 [Paenibacillus cookii]|uniref:Uncharacterized protein n=1 Tax=Paenibacillus cookii TaxID=157839 RepID=A0ABQ4LVC7_9BACL|nr:hypothetical protein J21TS3_20250 [Paenibacillus cookii]